MRARDFLKDDKDTWAGGGTEFEPDWHQEIGVDDGQGYQRASGNLPGGVNLSIAADQPGPSAAFDLQRGINVSKGPASLYLGDKGSVSGSYDIPVGQDSSVSLNAAGQRDLGVQSYGVNYQKGGFSAGVSKGTQPGATPQFNVGYSAQFEEDVDEGKIISDRELVDVYLKGKHYDQIIQKKVAERIPNRMVHAFIEKVAAKFGLNPTAFIYGPSRNEISEAFDKPYAFNWQRGDHGDYDIFIKLPDGSPLNIAFNLEGDDGWHVAFDRGHSQEITGEGDAQRIFATVLYAIQQFIGKVHPEKLYFSASKDVEPGQNPESRARLYERMVHRYAESLGYDVVVDGRRGHATFILNRKHGVAENFADGKVKGRSRPGRVQRAGASCNGSVTDLRARAKNASGEKAKMYHWCANMKSGRNK